MSHEPTWCPVMRPTRQEFQRPFMDYVSEVFAKDPDLPMFKVVPPPGWRPRRTKYPEMKDVHINTPIRQNVFGTKGAYRCIFVEHKGMTVDEFKRMAEDEGKQVPELQHKAKETAEDAGMRERAFWSGLTLNPPLYGADTPVSFFDPKVSFGWNLRDLQDLLSTKEMPSIPGVTSPMTYFGMSRSFFGWHKEDADLLSINYLHYGAPKIWYCISPKDQGKFERMAQGMFPQLHRACPAFIRHKDIMFSPTLLRSHGIPFMQAKHVEGEFIVLNAAAYHSGFNMGFNCAEAINFATPAWVEAGKHAVPCTCRKDAVHVSMKLFDPDWTDNDDSDYEDAEHGNTPGAKPGTKRHGALTPRAPGKKARLALAEMARDEVLGQPYATVGEDHSGTKFFALVQRVDRTATGKNMVVLRWLKEGPDGLYRPVPTYWEERADALITIRTQFLPQGLKTRARQEDVAPPEDGLGAGWKLLTLRSKILDTELRD